MESGHCAVCGIEAKQLCGRCRLVYYCGRDHQKQHWPVHRCSCGSFKIEQNESLGRYLVATRDLEEREVFLREVPLLRGPSFLSPPVCLGCYISLPAKCVPCVRCGWPMCSAGCADSPDHVPECRIITKMRKQKVTIDSSGQHTLPYTSVTVLRALFLREMDPIRWKKLLSFESHCQQTHKSDVHMALCASITMSLRHFFKFTTVSKEDIILVTSILAVNSFGNSDANYQSLFEWASLMEHSCHANCFYTTSNARELIVRTAKPVSHGEHLSIGYVDALKSTEIRRKILLAGKFFWCRCPRCLDPTEMGTFFSALRCPQPGCDGLCVPNVEWLKLEPAAGKEEPAWSCHCCQQQLPIVQVRQQLTNARREFEAIDLRDVQQCIDFLHQQEEAAQLGPDHFYLTEIRLKVAKKLGLSPGGIEALPKDLVRMKEKFCRHLLKLVVTLCPAEYEVRADLLHSLLVSIVECESRRCKQNNRMDLLQNVQEKRDLILETIDLLRYEPEGGTSSRILEHSRSFLQLLETMENMGARRSGHRRPMHRKSNARM